MKVDIDMLQKITTNLLSKLSERMGNEIEINNDYYWDFAFEELYDPYKEPKNLTLGQLSDDLNEIARLSQSDDAIIYDLKRIAEIFKTLSFENPTAF